MIKVKNDQDQIVFIECERITTARKYMPDAKKIVPVTLQINGRFRGGYKGFYTDGDYEKFWEKHNIKNQESIK